MTLQSLRWRLEAPCAAGDPRFWYPPIDAPDPRSFYERGRVVCRTCPVWRDCRREGEHEKFGMWGGLTPRERTGKRRFPCGTWIKYRQGCHCRDCTASHAAIVTLEARAS